MESLFIAWRLLLLVSLFAFPQLLGILLYFRLSRAPRLAAIAAVLVPALMFFWFTPIFFFAGLPESSTTRSTCGLPVLAVLFLLFVGTIFQLVLGLITQAALASWRLRKS